MCVCAPLCVRGSMCVCVREIRFCYFAKKFFPNRFNCFGSFIFQFRHHSYFIQIPTSSRILSRLHSQLVHIPNLSIVMASLFSSLHSHIVHILMSFTFPTCSDLYSFAVGTFQLFHFIATNEK